MSEHEHVPRHVLEQLVTEPGASAGAAWAGHLATCAHCTERKRAIEDARARFAAAHPAGAFARAVVARAEQPDATPRAPRRTTPLFAIGGGLVTAAAALVFWLLPGAAPAPDAVRLKGAIALDVYVKQGERTALLHDGDVVREGDRLGFVYTLARPRYLMLLGIDDTGTVTRYFPGDAASSALPAAGRAQLPLAIELDEHRGHERIVALFGAEPIDEAAARAALAAAYPRAANRALDLSAPPRLALPVEQTSVWFRKP